MNYPLLSRGAAFRAVSTLLALHLAGSGARAQTFTGGGDGVSWSQAANWSSLPVSNPGTFLNFTNNAPLTTNQNLGNPFVLNFLQNTGTGAFTINGNALDFQSNATVALNSLTATFNAPVILTSNTQFFAPNLTLAGGVSGAGQLRVGGTLLRLTGPGSWSGGTEIGFAGNSTLQVAANNALSGNVTFQNNTGLLEFASAAAVTYGGAISGFQPSATVRQSGPGAVLLTGASINFFGTVDVAAGTLQAGALNSLGNFSTVQVQSGGTLALAVADGFSGAAILTVAPGGTLDAAGFQQLAAVRVDNGGLVNLPAGSSLALGNNSIWTGTSTGAGALNLAGFNVTLNVGSNLQHTGGTTVPSGQTNVNTSNALPDTGLLTVNGGTLQHLGTETVDAVLVSSGILATTTFNVTSTMDLQAGGVGGNITVNGAFTKTTGGTASYSSGTLTLAGGGTVSAGQLDVSFGTVTGAFANTGTGTTNINFNGRLNGPTTNTSLLNVTSGGTIAGTLTNSGNTTVDSFGLLTAAVNNSGLVTAAGSSGVIAGNISGAGGFFAASANTTLSGVNSYTGGSTLFGSLVNGNTSSVQGAWTLTGSALNLVQNTNGTMAGNITGVGGSVQIGGTGNVTLSGNNSFTGGVFMVGAGSHFGIGSNNAAGSGGLIQGGDFKVSAEGGARTVANPLLVGSIKTEFTGANNLTFTDATAKTLNANAEILHTSTGITTVAGTFLGQNTATINVNAGKLVLGAAVNNGFRMDGAINVAAGATLEMVSNSFVKLGPTNLNGGTLIAANGVAVPTGLALNATGIIQGRVAAEAGSVIEATGPLTMGDATNFNGFFSNGELREEAQGVTILDRNQAVMGGLTEVGTTSTPGLLTAANGLFVDFGRAITGYGIVAGTNALAQASIINGDAAGNSNIQPLDFTGYVKGLGTFTDVVFSGTFSPGLSPAIVPVEDVIFGSAAVLIMEIGGLTPGAQHDQLDITGNLGLDGTLDVDLINGFNPVAGDTFNVFDGATTGTFDTFLFPTLNPGLSWDTTDLYTQGDLKVVPEPSTAALLLLAGVGAAARRRRR